MQQAPSAAELRDCLGELEAAIKPGYLSSTFQRLPLLVRGAWISVGKEVASALPGPHGEIQQLPEQFGRWVAVVIW